MVVSSLKRRQILFYDERREEGLTVDIPSTDYVKKTFGVKLSTSDVILDAGCGVCSHLLSLNCGEKVGLDILLGNLTVAKNRSKKLRLIRGDVESLPFKDGTFDAVLIVSVLHHVPNHELALNEICRVIREGGYLFIADSSVTGIKLIYPLAVIIQYFGSLLGSPESFGPKLDELYCLLKKNGFAVFRYESCTSFISFIFRSLEGFTRRFGILNLLIYATEGSFRSLDSKVLSKVGANFGLWFNLVAIKNKL